ncbi:DUF4440 domain-containing protein [Paraferrimonas haliotis]|uniref:DUF4440 domain-containing protein n=1 Tax=Paraferrimonas haliotis TaxID=2013866 RepID=UPI000BA98154|nr:DUF4440 domain-containing protein [Paraferrimonas haliotis]
MKRLLLCSLALFFVTDTMASISDNKFNAQDQQYINERYQIMRDGFKQLDASFVESLYEADAVYVPGSSKATIITGTQAIKKSYDTFFKKVQKKNATVDIDFRVVKRLVGNNQVTDVGYYIVEFRPAKNTEQPITHFAGKFVWQFERNGKQWMVALDSASHTDANHYLDALSQPGLYYGTTPAGKINSTWE